MLKIIRNILAKFVEDIDSGNSNISQDEQCRILRILSNIGNTQEYMSKTMAADYIGVCRSTFDSYVKNGLIPKGEKLDGFKELRWYKSDLDLFLNKQ